MSGATCCLAPTNKITEMFGSKHLPLLAQSSVSPQLLTLAKSPAPQRVGVSEETEQVDQ